MCTKQWLWGPGRIDPDHRGLTRGAYLERLATVREAYLRKLLPRLAPDDVPYVCRLEKARFLLRAELDQVPDDEFTRPTEHVPACRGCPHEVSCEAERVCDGWSLADFAAHLLTHEEKNVAPEAHATLQHMAEHEETHLRQVQAVVRELHRR